MSKNSILRQIATFDSVAALGLFSVVGIVNTSAQSDSSSIQINVLPGTLSISVGDCVMTINGMVPQHPLYQLLIKQYVVLYWLNLMICEVTQQ